VRSLNWSINYFSMCWCKDVASTSRPRSPTQPWQGCGDLDGLAAGEPASTCARIVGRVLSLRRQLVVAVAVHLEGGLFEAERFL
jgi:hypothetical protein